MLGLNENALCFSISGQTFSQNYLYWCSQNMKILFFKMEWYKYLYVLQIEQIVFLKVHIGLLKWLLQFSVSLKYSLICHAIRYFRQLNRSWLL